ncbi:hypothetical protein PFISCL1PPCAC_21937, partial [Pristionchus fissidentatus]
ISTVVAELGGKMRASAPLLASAYVPVLSSLKCSVCIFVATRKFQIVSHEEPSSSLLITAPTIQSVSTIIDRRRIRWNLCRYRT